MAVTVAHTTTVTGADDPTKEINKDQWNGTAAHTVAGLGALAELNAVTEATITLADNTTNNASTTAHGFLKKLSNVATEFMNGQGNWATPTASATLDGISAATASQAGISNGAHTIRWNFAQTADAKVSFEFGESAASTNGTSTANVPNQFIAKFSTVAASTASPIGFYSRALFVAAISPTSRQMIYTTGSASAPPICFTTGLNNGIYESSGICMTYGGTQAAKFTDTQAFLRVGSGATPALTDLGFGNAGLFWGNAILGFSASGAEVGRISGTNFVWGTAALATTATDGFLYIPTCAGTPTGVPTAFTGRLPMIYDSTGNKFWIYDGGWIGVALA